MNAACWHHLPVACCTFTNKTSCTVTGWPAPWLIFPIIAAGMPPALCGRQAACFFAAIFYLPIKLFLLQLFFLNEWLRQACYAHIVLFIHLIKNNCMEPPRVRLSWPVPLVVAAGMPACPVWRNGQHALQQCFVYCITHFFLFIFLWMKPMRAWNAGSIMLIHW